ncbi:MAG: DUF503 domain-containing protein [Chloroflexi bacterium]|nr:DUF503 domain-containing protein [Chloroflexota bacterium]
MPYTFCNLKIKIDCSDSLKLKRSIKSRLLARLKKYNLSVIEAGLHNSHTLLHLQVTMVRATESLLNQELENIRKLIEGEFPDLDIYEFDKEIYF